MSLTRLLQILMICLISSIAHSQKEGIKLANQPGWVKSIKITEDSESNQKNAGSYLYLLLDNQDHVDKEEFYRHRSLKVLNTEGIQEVSDISINFDPAYQNVLVHKIEVIRDGEKLNKLDMDRVQLVQRETNMERHLYDGSLSAIFNIADVRVNDIINYSYTIIGSNPVHKGKYQSSYYLSYNIPLKQIYYRVTVSKDKPLFYRVFHSDLKPEISTKGNFKHYSFEIKDPEIVKYDNNTPDWYDINAYVQFSQFKNWKEVVDNYYDYYRVSNSTRNWLKDNSEEILASVYDDSISPIIDFVQDDIRYLGFEGGLNSHAPSDPKDVFQRRYGDCKDKSLLLSELLRLKGIEAYPVLVHSYNGKDISKKLPSSNLFDHCIVQVRLEDEIKYIDPTISSQGGNINARYFPDYRHGLVLNENSTEIIELPEPEIKPVEIFETVRVNSIGGSAVFNVSTTYYGAEADARRREFNESTLEEIQDRYLDYYSVLYPHIKLEEEIIFDDFRDIESKFIVTEKYVIDSLWTPEPQNEVNILAEFYPLSLDTYLFPTEDRNRKMPYYLNKNLNVNHQITVLLPEEWNIQPDNVEIKNDYFEYSNTIVPSDRRLVITHNYKNLKDHVKSEDYDDFMKDINKVQENLNYYLTYNSAFAQGANSSNISWISLFIVFITMTLGAFVCYKIYYTYDIPAKVPEMNYRNSIGGWLVLFSIGLIISPVLILIEFFVTEDFLSPQVWNLWSSGYPEMTLLILFELIFNSLVLVTSIFVLIIFFQRRTIAPKIIVIYLSATLLLLIFDTMITLQIAPGAQSQAEISETYSEIGKSIIRALIWVPYLLISKRVKETFVVNLRDRQNNTSERLSEPVLSLKE